MPRTTKPSARMLSTLAAIANEIAKDRQINRQQDRTGLHALTYYPYTRTVAALEARGLVVTTDNRLGGPDPSIKLTAAGKALLAPAPAAPAPAPVAHSPGYSTAGTLCAKIAGGDSIDCAAVTCSTCLTVIAEANARASKVTKADLDAAPVVDAVTSHTGSGRMLAVLPRNQGISGMAVIVHAPRHGIIRVAGVLSRKTDTRADEESWTWTPVTAPVAPVCECGRADCDGAPCAWSYPVDSSEPTPAADVGTVTLASDCPRRRQVNKSAIKWRVCGTNGWDRRGTYLGHEIEIRYSYGSKHYELRFGSLRHGTYGTSNEEMARAKADAETLLPGWLADRQAERQARKDSEAEASRIAAKQNARRAAVADRLRALGIPCTDSFGITLTTEVAEMLAARLDSAATLTNAKHDRVTT